MVKDIDVGAYLYGRLGWIDSWRLQKLTYYSQAWGLAWTGEPLFDDRIQAWDDGPVAPALFRVNRYHCTGTTLLGADAAQLRPDQERVVDAVIAHYGDLTKTDLIDLTHSERPWKDAYEVRRNTVISERAMVAYYSKIAAVGAVACPVRPELPEPEISEAEYLAQVSEQRRIWAGTLELLAR